MRVIASLVALLALAAAPTAWAKSAVGDRILVVLDPTIKKGDYSNFFASLEGRGYQLTYKSPKDESAVLDRFGVSTYDHLIMFAPTAKSFAPGLSPQAVLKAQSTHLNTLYILSPETSELQRDTLREYDIELIERDNIVHDAFHSFSSSSNLIIPSSSLVSHGAILSPSSSSDHRYAGPIVYPRGTAHVLGMNPYLIDIAHAPKTAYTAEEHGEGSGDEEEIGSATGKDGKKELMVGKKLTLVSAMQNRENVRIGFIGSPGLLSDEWWAKKVNVDRDENKNEFGDVTGNKEFVEDITKWIFQETGVVKIVETSHHRKGEVDPRQVYRIKDDLIYNIELTQHVTDASGNSSWVPFSASDIQLDFTMLDPHIRTGLKQVETKSKSTVYEASFVAPDRHGVFKFVVEYWRPGWSYIRASSTASVVPFRHDEYPRFIVGAWPFYSSALSVSVAFLLFCGLWVAVGESDMRKKKAE